MFGSGVDVYELAVLVLGLTALAAAWLPAYTQHRALSLPVIILVVGAVVAALPLPLPSIRPDAHLEVTERLTEAVVVVALLGAGLKIDRPYSWRGWSTTWRTLFIVMPVTIAAVALLGFAAAGLPLAAALLLGASLAPTDPVLATDVQVGEPTLEANGSPREDDVRFTLTSEGGGNDALAFPFVYLAIRVASGWDSRDLWVWISWDLIGRTLIGFAIGWMVGRVISVIAFRPPGPLVALADTPQGFVAVAVTMLAYGLAELVSGYGFLAVFVAAVTLRGSERRHRLHGELHAFSEQIENLLVVGMLLLLGGSLSAGVLSGLTVGGAVVAFALVLIVRPMIGAAALWGTKLSRPERWAVGFFGVRGLGSVYYLAYGASAATFPAIERLWPIVVLTVVLSIVVHGVTSTPAMRHVDRIARRRVVRRRTGARPLKSRAEREHTDGH